MVIDPVLLRPPRAPVRSPELLLHGHVSKAVDTYAFAILLYELFTGERAWDGMPRVLLPARVRPQCPAPQAPSTRHRKRKAALGGHPAGRPYPVVLTCPPQLPSSQIARKTPWYLSMRPLTT